MHTPDPATSYRRVALKAPAPVAGAVKAARPPDAASVPRTLPSDTSEQPETRRGSAELSRRPAAGLAECGPDDPAGTDGKPKGARALKKFFVFCDRKKTNNQSRKMHRHSSKRVRDTGEGKTIYTRRTGKRGSAAGAPALPGSPQGNALPGRGRSGHLISRFLPLPFQRAFRQPSLTP
ncbi:hypothetical protein DFO55_1473 [Grimontella sp. AG753]|nr:hypothetical protein DFO55_1473 [Grimontella sp. AG753]